MTERLSPTFLTVPDNDDGFTIVEVGDFGELRDELPFNREALVKEANLDLEVKAA